MLKLLEFLHGRKTKATQPPDDEKGVEDVETIRISPAKCPGCKTKVTQPPDNEKGVEDAEKNSSSKTSWS